MNCTSTRIGVDEPGESWSTPRTEQLPHAYDAHRLLPHPRRFCPAGLSCFARPPHAERRPRRFHTLDISPHHTRLSRMSGPAHLVRGHTPSTSNRLHRHGGVPRCGAEALLQSQNSRLLTSGGEGGRWAAKFSQATRTRWSAVLMGVHRRGDGNHFIVTTSHGPWHGQKRRTRPGKGRPYRRQHQVRSNC